MSVEEVVVASMNDIKLHYRHYSIHEEQVLQNYKEEKEIHHIFSGINVEITIHSIEDVLFAMSTVAAVRIDVKI